VVALSEKSLTEKVLAGERISPGEALELYRRPLAELGQLATARRDLAKASSYDNAAANRDLSSIATLIT
jgi:hypothetical protein